MTLAAQLQAGERSPLALTPRGSSMCSSVLLLLNLRDHLKHEVTLSCSLSCAFCVLCHVASLLSPILRSH